MFHQNSSSLRFLLLEGLRFEGRVQGFTVQGARFGAVGMTGSLSGVCTSVDVWAGGLRVL